MPKIIIYITGKPGLHGFKRREFLWSEPHKLYLWGGRELELREFNDAWTTAYRRNHDMNPQVKVVGLEDVHPGLVIRTSSPEESRKIIDGALAKPHTEPPKKRTPKQPAVTRALEIA
jgi:hypothetical protein